jgi:glycosyltransferase involved in cell wall biosynthesis
MLGGGEHSFLDLLSRLKDSWDILAVVPEEGELETRLRQKGIKTQVIPLPSMKPWYAFSMLTSLIAYFNISRRYHPTLIYGNGPRAAFYGGLAGRFLGLPAIWHCRIADSDPYLDPILTRLNSRIIANSHATAKRFKGSLQSKVTVVHNGVDIERLRDHTGLWPDLIENTWKVVLVVARVSKWKRHDLALAAFQQIAALEPDAHLVCVGSPDELEPEWWNHLQKQTHQSEVSKRIHWVGQISDVRPWYKAAHLLLLCSDNEPFGRVLVEAMACGVPVIATRSGGIPEIVRHGEDGILVSPGNVDEVADAIAKLLGNEALRGTLADSALKRSEFFTLGTHKKKMIKTFQELIKT